MLAFPAGFFVLFTGLGKLPFKLLFLANHFRLLFSRESEVTHRERITVFRDNVHPEHALFIVVPAALSKPATESVNKYSSIHFHISDRPSMTDFMEIAGIVVESIQDVEFVWVPVLNRIILDRLIDASPGRMVSPLAGRAPDWASSSDTASQSEDFSELYKRFYNAINEVVN